jgi:hypothetical protein
MCAVGREGQRGEATGLRTGSTYSNAGLVDYVPGYMLGLGEYWKKICSVMGMTFFAVGGPFADGRQSVFQISP